MSSRLRLTLNGRKCLKTFVLQYDIGIKNAKAYEDLLVHSHIHRLEIRLKK